MQSPVTNNWPFSNDLKKKIQIHQPWWPFAWYYMYIQLGSKPQTCCCGVPVVETFIPKYFMEFGKVPKCIVTISLSQNQYWDLSEGNAHWKELFQRVLMLKYFDLTTVSKRTQLNVCGISLIVLESSRWDLSNERGWSWID